MGCALITPCLRADPPNFNPDKKEASVFANKTFDLGENKTSVFSNTYSGFNKTFQTGSADYLFSKDAPINSKPFVSPVLTMTQSYAVRSFPMPANFTGYDKTSSIPLTSSTFANMGAKGFDHTIDPPTYNGPEAQRMKQDMANVDKVLAGSKDLPNKSLTVDEVRALLNHNTKPDGVTPAQSYLTEPGQAPPPEVTNPSSKK